MQKFPIFMPFRWIRWKLRTRRVEFSTPLTRPTASKTHLISNDRHPCSSFIPELSGCFQIYTSVGPNRSCWPLIRMGKHSTDKIWVHKLGNFWWPMRPRAKHTRPKRRHITYKKYKNNHAFLPTASGCFWNNHIDHTYIGQISWMLLALQFQCAGWLLKLNDTIWGWYCSGYKSGETKTNGAVVFHVHLIFSFSVCGIPGISVSLSSFQGEE